MNKKTWKPYAAIVLILLYGVDIFWLSGFCVYYFGEWGILMYEGLLAVLALGTVALFREDVKRAFPFHRPTIAKTVGTVLMWIGTLLITMIPTSILLYAGNYLIHKGQPGYDRGLLPREKKKTLLGLVLISSIFLGLGILLFGIGMFE